MQTQSLDYQALLDQANTSAGQGDWQQSVILLKQAASIRPEDAGVLTGLGVCLLQLGLTIEALPHFQKAAHLAPAEASVHNNLGLAYSLVGDLEQSAKSYEQALACQPDYAPAVKSLAVVYLQSGREEAGVQLLAALAQQEPPDVEGLYLLGHCYEAAEDFESARTLYQRALEHQPDLAEAQQGLARLPNLVDTSRIARPEHAAKLAGLKKLRFVNKE
jgi:Flp pilus assembly protein TadD